ncbi:unnamed protein product [Euphydryas editha]|uniref:Uncharacterized protein n=1 Tax=Euphydryas editha TaxID=104508 RepID=A0AAU9V0C4_EUPED|nr:unnamed protein product [Euphydryas editha]
MLLFVFFRKVQAQRKFAQGAYIPPSANVINTIINRRVDPTNEKLNRYFFRHNTSARKLLDSISFESIHTHNPVVVLERLQEQPIVQMEDEPNDSNELLTPAVNNGTSNTQNPPSSKRVTFFKNTHSNASCVYTRAKVEKKITKLVSKKKFTKNFVLKRLRQKQIRNRKCNMKLRSAKPTSAVDTDFSIDDDKPLMFYTKRTLKTKRIMRKRDKHQSILKKKRDVLTSPPTVPSHEKEASHHNAVPYSGEASYANEVSSHNETPKCTEKVNTNDGHNHKDTQIQNEALSHKKANCNSSPIRNKGLNNKECLICNETPKYKEARICIENTNFKEASYYNESPQKELAVLLTPVAKKVTAQLELAGHIRYESNQEIAQVINQQIHNNVHQQMSDISNYSYTKTNVDVPRLPTRDKNSAQITQLNGDRQDGLYEGGSERSCETTHIVKTCSFCKSLIKNVKTYQKTVCHDGTLTLHSGITISPINDSIISLLNALETGQLASRILTVQNTTNVKLVKEKKNSDVGTVADASFVDCVAQTDPIATESQAERKTTRVTRRTGKTTHYEKEQETCTDKTNKGKIVEAPAFRPTEAEFRDPVAYFQKIMPEAAKFGLCKVIAPPEFKPTCTLTDSIRFVVTNQYIARFYSRWGPVTRELCALRAFLASQNITFSHSPLLEGLEVNLPKMLHFVQRQGGLKANVESRTYVDTRKWNRLAEELNYTKLNNPAKKLDQIYVKYLLPYDALTQRERQELTEKMDKRWSKRNDKLMQRAQNPLHRQKRLLGESDSSEDDDFEDNEHMTAALNEAEECVIANNALKIFFPTTPSTSEIESQYWKLVLLGNEHVCVNTASIDTGTEGYGFSKNKNDPYGKHPWNLKMLSQNTGNVLRLLGPVLGVTVPTLHVGMIYSTSCWHRDPHGLPWIEYMHTGPEKIWYGIPDSESSKFRRAVENLCPTACQNKSIWLPSDIAMIPPTLLLERNVSMSRVVQNPGEYIIVFPKAYSCSICTGYTVSESVYFATNSWIKSVNYVFQELRQSCEPTMFSLEQLLISVARDPNASLTMLQLVHESFSAILSEELENRRQLEFHGLKPRVIQSEKRNAAGAWNVHENECEICRSTLYLSRVKGVFRKKYSVCLRHALQVLDSKNKKIDRRETETFELEYFFGNTELEEVISSVINRLTKTT